jgi:hypothetical protein
MITGYNHNVKYQDRMFHVQTEDSGVQNPHIITLLYYGGNILDSVKSSYAERVSSADMVDQVTKMMQAQHKDVLRGLITGRYDQRITERSKNAAFLNGPAPLNVDAGSQHHASFGFGMGAKASKPAAAPTPMPQVPTAAAPAADGTFSTEGSLLDALGRVVPTLNAEDLKAALDANDDSFVFGETTDGRGFGDLALEFLKGI